MTRADCERLREIAPELALGIADGEDRALALEHVAGCAECRAHLERLAHVADELLLLAPAAEPPPGFEGRVAAALEPRRRRSLRRRVALPIAAAATAAAAAAAIVWFALADDRDLAGEYRETLAVANGRYFTAAPLEAPGGEWAGYVYGYQGKTSWVLAVVSDLDSAGPHRLEAVTRDGERLPLRGLEVSGGEGSAGSATPVPYEDLNEVRLLDDRGREVAESDLGE